MERIQPRPTATSQPWFDGCSTGELRLQYCAVCREYQFYPRTFCVRCGQRELEWRRVSGRGRVASFTVVRHGISAAYPAPYIIALIDLAEGPRLMSMIVDAETEQISVGAAVAVGFQAWSEDTSLPVFQLLEET